MTKRELIQAITVKTELTDVQAEVMLDAFGVVITETPIAGKKTQLPGVLTASTVQHAEREGHNPATGEVITIPAHRVTEFAPVSTPKDTP